MRSIYLIMTSLLLLSLASCSTLTRPTTPAATGKKISWDSRVQSLSAIQSWNIKGKMGIRQRNEAVSANLQWQQTQQNYVIALYGPLGSSSQILTGRPGRVELVSSDGKKAYAATPEELLAKQTGWNLPVSNLYYWIRGIPVPNVPAEKQFDQFNRLAQLNQQGWRIQYLDYTSVGNTDVPSRIFLDNPGLNVKIIINQWQF